MLVRIKGVFLPPMQYRSVAQGTGKCTIGGHGNVVAEEGWADASADTSDVAGPSPELRSINQLAGSLCSSSQRRRPGSSRSMVAARRRMRPEVLRASGRDRRISFGF